MLIKNGMRLQSQVCNTQIIVVRSSAALTDLCAGGVPMVELGTVTDANAVSDPALNGGAVMGKRYVDGSGGEVLVTKGGAGTLTVGTTPMVLKEAKPLPASD